MKKSYNYHPFPSGSTKYPEEENKSLNFFEK